jgi:hypothetical protein
MRSRVRRIAISGLVALATVLGGVAIPATAMAQLTSGVRSTGAVVASAAGPARAAAEGGGFFGGAPKISCVLAADCVAVEGTSGLSDDGGAVPIRVARWNGKSWKGVGVALPTGTKSADLEAVSCQAATSCLVVGDYYKSTSSSAPNFPLALIYNGTSLKPTPAVPLPKGATDVTLADVSCATSRYCVAIATAEPSAGIFESSSGPVILIETWNGAKWTLRTIATSVKTEVEPSAVSCATAAFCVVAGELTTVSGGDNFAFGLYLGSWNGKTLTRMKAPAEGGANSVPEPVGVSCATTANCGVTGIVLGDVTSSSEAPDVTPFTQVWNGKTWQVGKAVRPKGAQSIFLGVSCYGAHSCETVGEGAASATAASGYALAVSYKGAAGTVQAVPVPAKGRSTAFTDVSCLPGGACLATGWTGKSKAATPSLMTGVWGGKSWKLDPGF